jgi:hypothetical protein
MAAAVVLVWGQRASAQPTAAEVNEDLWYVLKLQGQQCGYMHTVTRLEGREVRTQSFTSLKIARGQTKVKVTVEQEHAETVDGKPLRIMSRMGLGETPVTYRGTIEGDRIKLETEQYGSKKAATYRFDPEIKFVWGQELAQRQRGLRPGTAFSVKTYDPSLKPDGPVNLQVSVRGKEKVDVLGLPRELHRVTTVMEIPSTDSAGGEEAGKGMTLEFRYEHKSAERNLYKVTFDGVLADNGLVQVQARLFKQRFAPRQRARSEIGDLMAHVAKGLLQDLAAYRVRVLSGG